jgi:hypothetical protein
VSATESFWARWARVKREANVAAGPAGPAEIAEPAEPAELAEAAELAERAEPAVPAESAMAVEPPEAVGAAELAEATVSGNSGLPSIESIIRGSDIRPFLQPGVPVELTRAALRAAWVADPSIRDFIGIADSQWDFNDPTAMPGFGPLDATDSARSLAARAVARIGRAPEALARMSGVAAGPVVDTVNLPREGQVDRVWISPEARKSVSYTGNGPPLVQEPPLVKESAAEKEPFVQESARANEPALLQEPARANEPALLQDPAGANDPGAVVEQRPDARVHGSALPKLVR